MPVGVCNRSNPKTVDRFTPAGLWPDLCGGNISVMSEVMLDKNANTMAARIKLLQTSILSRTRGDAPNSCATLIPAVPMTNPYAEYSPICSCQSQTRSILDRILTIKQ
ncbi:MAG: hypothetical protein IPK94_10240 [Saprospiraceae bacterium]|nr:hypothetical protein [Saprospiraceae bacterium]